MKINFNLKLKIMRLSPLIIDKGFRLLMRLKDDNLIELKTEEQYEDKEGKIISNKCVYIVSVKYPLSVPDIDKIINSKIDKIRIEHRLNYIEYIPSDDTINDFFILLQAMKSRLSGNKDSIYNDF